MVFTEKEKNTSEFLYKQMKDTQIKNFIFTYNEKLIVEVSVEDFYDSDNGEEYNSERYDEYNEWVVYINKVIKDEERVLSNKKYLLLNYKTFPQKISTLNGKVILNRC